MDDKELEDSPGVTATAAEVCAAVKALSVTDLTRLRKAAEFRCRGLGRKAFGLTGEDLVQEAFKRTLEGGRKWKKEVFFVGHMLGTIRSVASHWGESVDRAAPTITAADLVRTEDEDDPLENVGQKAPDPERVAAAREEVERIETILANDEEASLVLEGMKEEMTGPEIQKALAISVNKYDATLKRLRRKVKSAKKGGGDADA